MTATARPRPLSEAAMFLRHVQAEESAGAECGDRVSGKRGLAIDIRRPRGEVAVGHTGRGVGNRLLLVIQPIHPQPPSRCVDEFDLQIESLAQRGDQRQALDHLVEQRASGVVVH